MIVRILTEGQFDIDDATVDQLNELDDQLTSALEGGDEGFRLVLSQLLGLVREKGTSLPDDELKPSDAVLPQADASVEEVRALLSDEGIIPG